MVYTQIERREMALEWLPPASGGSHDTPASVAKFGVRRLAAAFEVLCPPPKTTLWSASKPRRGQPAKVCHEHSTKGQCYIPQPETYESLNPNGGTWRSRSDLRHSSTQSIAYAVTAKTKPTRANPPAGSNA